jgi:hypothetical protein
MYASPIHMQLRRLMSGRAGLNRLQKNSQLFHALKGHKIVAGGNAPGKRNAHSPTLKGAHNFAARDAKPA